MKGTILVFNTEQLKVAVIIAQNLNFGVGYKLHDSDFRKGIEVKIFKSKKFEPFNFTVELDFELLHKHLIESMFYNPKKFYMKGK